MPNDYNDLPAKDLSINKKTVSNTMTGRNKYGVEFHLKLQFNENGNPLSFDMLATKYRGIDDTKTELYLSINDKNLKYIKEYVPLDDYILPIIAKTRFCDECEHVFIDNVDNGVCTDCIVQHRIISYSQEEPKDDVCSICRNEVYPSTNHPPPCGHTIHKTCLKKLEIKDFDDCPSCNEPLGNDDSVTML